MATRRVPSVEEQRQRMLFKCSEQAALLQAAQERMHRLCASRPDLVITGHKLVGRHHAVAGSGSFASVWASKHCFDKYIQQNVDSMEEGEDTDASVDQDTPFKSCLKVLQLPIGVAKQAQHWPSLNLQLQLPLAHRSLDQLYKAFDELRWQRLFIQEAEAMVACQGHPAIAKCQGWCFDDQLHLPTLVMEYAGGANLWHTLFGTSRPRPQAPPLPVPLTWQQATSIYLQLLDSIDWMHNRLPGPANVFCLHRDVSPGNVVIAWPRGLAGMPQIKLVDFGLSELISMDESATQEWLQPGVAVGPDVMFIDPLMWVCRQYGRGTDIFGMAHLLMLLLFGTRAAYNFHRPSANGGLARTEEFNAICMNRTQLRNVLRMTPAEALSHPKCSLMPRWQACPEPLLQMLMTQCVLCTTAGEDALRRRPTSRQLLSELAGIRNTLPVDLAVWVPTTAQLSVGLWAAPRTTPVTPASVSKK